MVLKWITKREYGLRSHDRNFRKKKTGWKLYNYQCAVCKRTFQTNEKLKEGSTKYNQLAEKLVRKDRPFRYWDAARNSRAVQWRSTYTGWECAHEGGGACTSWWLEYSPNPT